MIYRDPKSDEPVIKYFEDGPCKDGNFKACLNIQHKFLRSIGSKSGATLFDKRKSRFIIRGENEDQFHTLGQYAYSKCPLLRKYKTTEKDLKIKGKKRIVN